MQQTTGKRCGRRATRDAAARRPEHTAQRVTARPRVLGSRRRRSPRRAAAPVQEMCANRPHTPSSRGDVCRMQEMCADRAGTWLQDHPGTASAELDAPEQPVPVQTAQPVRRSSVRQAGQLGDGPAWHDRGQGLVPLGLRAPGSEHGGVLGIERAALLVNNPAADCCHRVGHFRRRRAAGRSEPSSRLIPTRGAACALRRGRVRRIEDLRERVDALTMSGWSPSNSERGDRAGRSAALRAALGASEPALAGCRSSRTHSGLQAAPSSRQKTRLSVRSQQLPKKKRK